MSSDPASEVAGFCGAELLPHASADDGSPAPVICTRAPHPPGSWHGNEALGTRWRPDLSEESQS